MPQFIIVDSTTGELHTRDCEYCGITSISGEGVDDETLQIFIEANQHEGHSLFEITSEERDQFSQIRKFTVRNGERTEIPHDENLFKEEEIGTEEIESISKIDINNATERYKDRPLIDDLTKPIEVDTPNGKEVIGYEQKPVGVVKERFSKVPTIEGK